MVPGLEPARRFKYKSRRRWSGRQGMKIALLRTSAAVAIVFSFGLTALVDAEEPAGPGQAPVEQPAGAPQDVRATVVTPEGRHQQSATVERQQVPVGDGETVTVLRPVAAGGAERASPKEEARRGGGPTPPT